MRLANAWPLLNIISVHYFQIPCSQEHGRNVKEDVFNKAGTYSTDNPFMDGLLVSGVKRVRELY